MQNVLPLYTPYDADPATPYNTSLQHYYDTTSDITSSGKGQFVVRSHHVVECSVLRYCKLALHVLAG